MAGKDENNEPQCGENRLKHDVGTLPSALPKINLRVNLRVLAKDKWILQRYFCYYLNSRTHLSLEKDAPNPRAIQPPETRNIVAIPEVGGLHHRYERRAA